MPKIAAIKQQTVTEQAFEEKIFACVLYIVGKLIVFYITGTNHSKTNT